MTDYGWLIVITLLQTASICCVAVAQHHHTKTLRALIASQRILIDAMTAKQQ